MTFAKPFEACRHGLRAILALSVPCLLGASAAVAATPYQVCASIYDDGLKSRCVASIGLNHFDENALSVCASVYDDGQKVACIQQVANLRYGNGAVSVCASIYDDGEKIRCLETAGIRFNPSCPSPAAIRFGLSNALDNLRANRVFEAGSILTEMLTALQGC